MKVAVATQELTRVDAHFGWARHLMFYEVSQEGCYHLETLSFPDGRQDGDHGKLSARLQAMAGCDLLFASQVGPEAERELARTRTVPLRQFSGQPVALALEALQDSLRGGAPLWLRRAEQRFRRDG